MTRWIRRLLWLGVLAAIGGAAVTYWSRRPLSSVPLAPVWPPIEPVDTTPRWVAPVNGRCPDGYPVKANDNSGIYHLPGGRFYERTVPERCYVDAADAAADGYRAAKA